MAVAWFFILARDGYGTHLNPAAELQPDHHLDAAGGASIAAQDIARVIATLPFWALMCVAMMLPIAIPAVRHTGLNSIRRRRQWAMALFTAVYLAVWIGLGAFALAGQQLVARTLAPDARVLLATALVIAAAWQLSHAKRRALNTCRRTVPLPPAGRKADSGCARFALLHGWRCVTSCWALMLVMLAVGHTNPVWMVALTALITAEELTAIGRRLLRPAAALLALTASAVLLSG